MIKLPPNEDSKGGVYKYSELMYPAISPMTPPQAAIEMTHKRALADLRVTGWRHAIIATIANPVSDPILIQINILIQNYNDIVCASIRSNLYPVGILGCLSPRQAY